MPMRPSTVSRWPVAADFDLNGNDMTVDGLVQLSATSTFLIVPTNSLLSPDAVIVNSGATLGLRGGTMTINEETGDALLEINAGGILNGSGAISFSDAVTPGTRLLINDGTLNAAFAHPIDAGGSGAGTLSINASDADSRIDLDGDGEAGVVSVSRNDTLDVNVPLSDSFGGVINLAEGATLDMSQAWSASGATSTSTPRE